MEFYGENLLSNFDALPTWVYSTPHNIQRNTPQNASCEACHANPEIFLTADKVQAVEQNANQSSDREKCAACSGIVPCRHAATRRSRRTRQRLLRGMS